MSDAARRHRLLLRCREEVDRCALLGAKLDDGPHADPMLHPVRSEHGWISMRASRVLATGASASELERLARWLRANGDGSTTLTPDEEE